MDVEQTARKRSRYLYDSTNATLESGYFPEPLKDLPLAPIPLEFELFPEDFTSLSNLDNLVRVLPDSAATQEGYLLWRKLWQVDRCSTC